MLHNRLKNFLSYTYVHFETKLCKPSKTYYGHHICDVFFHYVCLPLTRWGITKIVINDFQWAPLHHTGLLCLSTRLHTISKNWTYLLLFPKRHWIWNLVTILTRYLTYKLPNIFKTYQSMAVFPRSLKDQGKLNSFSDLGKTIHSLQNILLWFLQFCT